MTAQLLLAIAALCNVTASSSHHLTLHQNLEIVQSMERGCQMALIDCATHPGTRPKMSPAERVAECVRKGK